LKIISPAAPHRDAVARDRGLVLASRALRAFGDGYVAILLPVYLAERGFAAFAVGAVSTATLLGSALLTLALGMVAHRIPRRGALLAASLLMAGTGFGFAAVAGLWPLLIIAFAGTLNPSGGDVSVFLPLEHTVLAHSAPEADRTAVFARYAFVGSVVGAVGTLAAGAVDWLAPMFGREAIIDAFFVLYGAAGLLSFILYRRLSPHVEASEKVAPSALRQSRRRVYQLAALFSLDSFGGGLVLNSLLALWIYERFGLNVATTGAIFFATGLCSAASYFAAVPLSRRFGLVNTMVFTHLPSNVFLALVPFAPSIWLAIGLLVLRSLLSQMDVPTRSSYVMAVVQPEERPAAASVTAVPRSLASAAAPLLSGWLLGVSTFGWPLVAAGALKGVYDLMLLRGFARVKPPEETERP
jgi:MFS family permease